MCLEAVALWAPIPQQQWHSGRDEGGSPTVVHPSGHGMKRASPPSETTERHSQGAGPVCPPLGSSASLSKPFPPIRTASHIPHVAWHGCPPPPLISDVADALDKVVTRDPGHF